MHTYKEWTTPILTYRTNHLESRRALRDEGRARLGDTVRKRELEARDQELLDVRAADVLGLLDLDNTEDLG